MHLPEINVLDVMKTADRLKARRCRKAGCGPQLTCPRAPGGRNLAASRAPPHQRSASWWGCELAVPAMNGPTRRAA